MASELLVNKITPESGTTLTLGESGDTISFASGVLPTLESLTITGDLTVDTDTFKVDSTNNRVGVGTTSPSQKLDVVGSIKSSQSITIGTQGLYEAGSIYSDSNWGMIFRAKQASPAQADFMWANSTNTERMRIDSSGNVGIGTSSPNTVIDARQTKTGASTQIRVYNTDNSNTTTQTAALFLSPDSRGNGALIFAEKENADFSTVAGRDVSLVFSPVLNNSETEAMRINSSGNVGIAQTNPTWLLQIKDAGNSGSSDEIGQAFDANGSMYFQTNNTSQMFLNDSSGAAGTHNYILFRYQGATIGDIDTTNNTTIRYNTFTGGHWSQFYDGTNPELKKGTVMSLTGDKLEYSKCEKIIIKEDGTEEVQKYEIAGTHEIGSEVTVPNDDYGEENSTTTATVVSNYIADHLVKVKVSDSIADKAVYGVWAGKYNDGDLSVEALGTSTIRIKQGEVLEVGDLLESAGDGTAQKQTDDTIKNSTIAKVTSPTVIETFDDNSFLVSCVLYCG